MVHQKEKATQKKMCEMLELLTKLQQEDARITFIKFFVFSCVKTSEKIQDFNVYYIGQKKNTTEMQN